jgi:cytochrome c-type biogenesis protein CcmE
VSNKKNKFIVGSILIVSAVAYLITTGISSTSKFFFTVDELAQQSQSYHGKGLKIKGNVVMGSIVRNPNDKLDVAFSIEEKTSVLPVVYKGITPDMFKDGGEVVVEGTLMKDGTFHANTLLTSCPSKYEAEKEAGKVHPDSIPKDGYDDKKPITFDQPNSPKTKI